MERASGAKVPIHPSLCIPHHYMSHRPSLPPVPLSTSALLPPPTSFSHYTAVKRYKYLGAWATSNKINWREGLWQAITPFWGVWQRFIRSVTAAEALDQSTGTRRKIVPVTHWTGINVTLVPGDHFRVLSRDNCTTYFPNNTSEFHVKVLIGCVWYLKKHCLCVI